MPSPMITRRHLLYAIPETTVGTAESPASAPLTVVDAFDVQFTPDTAFDTREAHYGFGAQRGTIGMRLGTLTFSTHLYGSASTGWASLLLPACGMYLDTSVYRLSSLAPASSGNNTDTLTFYFYQDGRRVALHGAMGTWRIVARAGQKIVIEWTFRCIENTPTDVALPTFTAPSALPARFAAASLTIASVSPKVAELVIDLGNEVQIREDANAAAGAHSAVIVNRRVNGTLRIESELVATYSPYADFVAGTTRAFACTLGASGNKVDVAIPDFQIAGPPSAQDNNGKLYETLVWQAVRDDQTGEGDDEMTLTLG